MISSSKLRESLPSFRLPILQEAGLIPPDKQQWFDLYRRTYEPGQGVHYQHTDRPAVQYHNSKTYVDRALPVIEEQIATAVRDGNESVMDFVRGMEGEDKDVPFAEVLELEDIIHGDEFNILIFTGGQGGGKSYFAYLLAKYKVRLCERDNIPVRAVTNSLSAVERNEELEFIDSPKDLLDYRMENPGHIVFVLDEASSFFDSKGAGNAAELAKFTPFLRRLRKMGILPIIVSHRTKDIGTDIRKLDSTIFVHKPDKQTAVFYDDEEDNGSLNNEDKRLEVSGYTTERRYDYESEDLFISWNWDGLEETVELFDNPQEFKQVWETKGIIKDLKETAEKINQLEELTNERDEIIQEAAELDYSQSEIAEMANVSKAKVSELLSAD